MITLFKVNDIAILSKVNPSDNILRFAPTDFFIIPEENRELIKRILKENIEVIPDPATSYTPIVKEIVDYKSPDTNKQPQNITEIAWALKTYLTDSFNSVVYDYNFNNWTKNPAGEILIDENGFNFNGKTFIQTNITINPTQIFTINIDFQITQPFKNTIYISMFGANETTSSIPPTIGLLRISSTDYENYQIAPFGYRATTNGTWTIQTFKNLFTITPKQQCNLTINFSDDKVATCTFSINNIQKELLRIENIKSFNCTRCRIGASKSPTINYYNNIAIQRFYITKEDQATSEKISNCISYLKFLKE